MASQLIFWPPVKEVMQGHRDESTASGRKCSLKVVVFSWVVKYALEDEN
jgi:hypothetical protein